MRKTSIYLDEGLDLALSLRAKREGITKAALIRHQLSEAMKKEGVIRPLAIGVFDGPSDLAMNVDDYLDKTGFGE